MLTIVSLSADTSMCSLTFKCIVWPWPLRYGAGSRSLHIVSMRTTFVLSYMVIHHCISKLDTKRYRTRLKHTSIMNIPVCVKFGVFHSLLCHIYLSACFSIVIAPIWHTHAGSYLEIQHCYIIMIYLDSLKTYINYYVLSIELCNCWNI